MKLFALQIAFIFTIVHGASVPESQEITLSSDIPTCTQADINLNECLKEVFQKMLPKLYNGNKELNIPPIDPFLLQNSKYEYSNGVLSGRIALKDTKVYGLSRTQLKDVRFSMNEEGTHMEVDSYTPRLFIEGNYKADMKLNDIKMNPKGYFNVTMSDISLSQEMDGKFEIIDGNRHLRLVSYNIVPEVGDMKIYANGLFPDPALNAIVLDFVNQYWREVYKVLLPETRTYWEPIALNAMNQFLLKIPFDKLLTKD